MSSKVKVLLVSATEDPVATLFAVWHNSRTQGHPLSAQNVVTRIELERQAAFNSVCQAPDCHGCAKLECSSHSDHKPGPFEQEVRQTFLGIIKSGIPVAENISFTFQLCNVSIAFREQMVRHRIGVRVGERLGVDMVPDLAGSTWWAQSMRVLDMGRFFQSGQYERPESVGEQVCQDFHNIGSTRPVTANELFVRLLEDCESTYQQLVKAGVPAEDARMVLPLACTHDISWTLNLQSLMHVIGKRSCWILQSGFWMPVIQGMIEELCAKVDPVFRELACPPCLKDNKFAGCHFCLDNEYRVQGKDPLPPCPLFLNHEKARAIAAEQLAEAASGHAAAWKLSPLEPELWIAEKEESEQQMIRQMQRYEALWRRNPVTGASLDK